MLNLGPRPSLSLHWKNGSIQCTMAFAELIDFSMHSFYSHMCNAFYTSTTSDRLHNVLNVFDTRTAQIIWKHTYTGTNPVDKFLCSSNLAQGIVRSSRWIRKSYKTFSFVILLLIIIIMIVMTIISPIWIWPGPHSHHHHPQWKETYLTTGGATLRQ